MTQIILVHGEWHQVDIIEEEDSEVLKKFGGPCRGRTYGPLIKSPAEDLPQNTHEEQSSAKDKDS